MEIQLIEERIKAFRPQNKTEELNAFKEILQEITLLALSRSEFFKVGSFQGGTSLRIAHGLNRFSEDLDFILFDSNPFFKWDHFFHEIELEFKGYGLNVQVQDRSKIDSNVKKAFLKENSFGKILKLTYERSVADKQMVQIKLEIDTNPPMGSNFQTKVISYPEPFSIVIQDLPSLFAGKLHALLSRSYVKGRDWFDFIWYLARNTQVNYIFLENALNQQGPWKDKNISINKKWLTETLQSKIEEIDWMQAKNDVKPFLRLRQQASLDLWDKDFFSNLLKNPQVLEPSSI
jgi:predicted nucleotidyltransferase component of viral defense system